MKNVVILAAICALIAGCASTQSVQIKEKKETTKALQEALKNAENQAVEKKKSSPNIRQTFGYRFTDYIFDELNASPSECDSAAVSDETTEWVCAGYSYNYLEFIERWEEIYSSSSFQKQFALTPKHDWMYFNDENGGIDFYGKGYSIQKNQVLVAFDSSELGREIFVGVNPNILAIFQAASGNVLGFGQPVLKTEIQKLLPSTDGSYNCKDFKNQKEAIEFFNSKGFSANYDPYGLDADNNGIPCESASKHVVSQTSKCPSGKSWVAPYKRKNGTRVRGHCRKRR